MIIAIDGTLASGKGTLAARLADHYGLPHMDTGLLYRAVAAETLRHSLSLDDIPALEHAARRLDLRDWPQAQLRTDAVSAQASRVAAIPQVRQALFERQRAFAVQPGGAVLDGRDITTVIAPFADVKFFVDAAQDERIRRRLLELARNGTPADPEVLAAHVRERDLRDATRAEAPLVRVPDAHLIDTTHLNADAAFEAASAIVDAVMERA